MTFTVELPVPPSANASYRNVPGRGRAKTKAYKVWRRNAVLTIFAQVRADRRVGGKVYVHVELPDACRLDCDNAIKPILDALVESRRIDDDRNVLAIHASKHLATDKALVTVSPWAVPA